MNRRRLPRKGAGFKYTITKVCVRLPTLKTTSKNYFRFFLPVVIFFLLTSSNITKKVRRWGYSWSKTNLKVDRKKRLRAMSKLRELQLPYKFYWKTSLFSTISIRDDTSWNYVIMVLLESVWSGRPRGNSGTRIWETERRKVGRGQRNPARVSNGYLLFIEKGNMKMCGESNRNWSFNRDVTSDMQLFTMNNLVLTFHVIRLVKDP